MATTTGAVRALTLVPGTLIDNVYEVGEELGSGAFGKVFAGVQHPIGRKVAIKVLALDSDDQIRKRFLREAQAAAAIDHPNVVTIYHFGFLPDGPPYIVMEFLNGHDLEKELEKNGALEPARTKALFSRCLDALAGAHQNGIVHKDLKPSNLFLTYPGQARELLKIVDFGIAHMTDPSAKADGTGPSVSRLTTQGNVVGTPQYLAPEYIESQAVSPAVDVYQMGLIVSEALTGQPVVAAAKLLDAVIAHLEGVELPDEVRNSAFGPVLERAVAKASEDRYPDAAALRDALAEVDLTQQPAAVPRTASAETTDEVLRSSVASQTPTIVAEVPDVAGSALSSSTPDPASAAAAKPVSSGPSVGVLAVVAVLAVVVLGVALAWLAGAF